MARYHLAQLNVGRIRAPLDSPELAGFVGGLEAINALADGSPGFVWRLQTEEGDATAVRAFDDEMLLLNMSVWTSVEALAEFTYNSDHVGFLRQRRQWFERLDEAILVLWWVPAGHRPTVEEAKDRLDLLRSGGPSPEAFTFRSPYPPPDAGSDPAGSGSTSSGSATAGAEAAERWGCPAG